MKYVKLGRTERETQIRDLTAMPAFLAENVGTLSWDVSTQPGPDGTLSPVEQCWHLADLEREGFGARIHRLIHETDPFLPDFDGTRIAAERQYRSRPLADAIEAFRQARLANLAALQALEADQWLRGGTQEGVGPVALCDVPHMMAEHDSAHKAEIEAWIEYRSAGL